METTEKKQLAGKQLGVIIVLIALIAAIIAIGAIVMSQRNSDEKETHVDIVATLDKIVQTSDLSTAVFKYEGIVDVPNQKKTSEIDYYISYEAKVYAGIDFSEISFVENKEKKTITAKIPQVEITDIVVDPASLDYIFNNKKADNINVTQVALTACEEDIYQEVTTESALLEIAQENAKNAIRALTEPIIEQAYKDYTLVIE